MQESTVASYWLVAGARGTGDVERAWYAAIAAWVRAAQAGRPRRRASDGSQSPRRRRPSFPNARASLPRTIRESAAAAMRKEWESLKQAWT